MSPYAPLGSAPVSVLKSPRPGRARTIQAGVGAVLAAASALVIIYCFLAGMNGDMTAALIGLGATVPFFVGVWLTGAAELTRVR
jgi:hypothetical protein